MFNQYRETSFVKFPNSPRRGLRDVRIKQRDVHDGDVHDGSEVLNVSRSNVMESTRNIM